ncbi:MAG: SirB2 family protein [Gammaproteobacteria bacterium]|nr:SirB2 family protein [Gammaproteobacteria bacterium]MCF6363550.1 SirB2 family protein [Gammaproteobacteria bacterium]
MTLIKIIHMSFALLSIAGFFARGVLMIRDSALLQQRWVKTAPHAVDTVLLLSAIILASQWGLASLGMPWLQAKIGALLVYILFGVVAIRPGRSKPVRIGAWLGALLTFAYMVGVAITKNPWVFA